MYTNQTISLCLVLDIGVVLGTVNATNVAIVVVSTQAKHWPTVDSLPSFLPDRPDFLAEALITIPGHCCTYMYTPSLISVRFVSLFFNFLSPVKLSCRGSYTPGLYESYMSIWFGGWAVWMEGGQSFMPPVCDKSQSICQCHYLLKHKGCLCYCFGFNGQSVLL